MAVVAYTQLNTAVGKVYSWVLASGDTGAPVICPDSPDKTV